MTILLCSMSMWSKPSVVAIGRAATQSNDFAHAQKMIVNDGFVLNQKTSTANCSVYEYSKAKYADEALIIKLYKMPKSSKVEKFVVFIGQKFLSSFAYDLSMLGYEYTDTQGMSIEPFQELYEDGKYAVGIRINPQGWYEATFFRWDQKVKFE